MKQTIKLTESEVAAACICWCERKLKLVADIRLESETKVGFNKSPHLEMNDTFAVVFIEEDERGTK